VRYIDAGILGEDVGNGRGRGSEGAAASVGSLSEGGLLVIGS
jgi:hypothetical protein